MINLTITIDITPEEVKELFGEGVVCRFRDIEVEEEIDDDDEKDLEEEEEVDPVEMKFIGKIVDAAKMLYELRK